MENIFLRKFFKNLKSEEKNRLLKEIGLSRQTIFYATTGKTAIRVKNAAKLIKNSNGELDFNKIYHSFLEQPTKE